MSTRIFKCTLCLLLLATTAPAQINEKAGRTSRHENRKSLSTTINAITAKAEKLATNVATRFEEDFGPFDTDWPSGNAVTFPGDELGTLAQESISRNADDDARKTKRYVKVYSVNGGDKLQIDNQYGKVTVSTWTKNEFKVDVEIKAYAGSDDKADDLIKAVNISDSKSGNLVAFKTSINRQRNSWWGSNTGKKQGVQINYTVSMPAKNALAITNKYGATDIADFDGPVSIQSSYGSLKVGKLNNNSCSVTTSYGSADIGSFGGGSIKSSYGSINLNSANNLDADFSYGSAKIGALKGDVKFNLDYMGGFRIGNLGSGLKNLDINAGYSGINIGTDEGGGFNFDVTVKYSGFKYEHGRVANLVVNPDDTKPGLNPTKNYKGRFGKGGARVHINSSYTSVKFD